MVTLAHSTTAAVGVSGGADSMALALLLKAYIERRARLEGHRAPRLVALVVDHGLRESSRAEALTVQEWLNNRGASADTDTQQLECNIIVQVSRALCFHWNGEAVE